MKLNKILKKLDPLLRGIKKSYFSTILIRGDFINHNKKCQLIQMLILIYR
jgi:hypothetical protein